MIPFRVRVALALVASALPAAAAEPKPNLPAATGPLRQLIAVLEKVTHEKSATEAKPKLEELWVKHTDAMKTHLAAVASVPTGQQATLLEVAGKELAVLNKSLQAEHNRIFREREAAYNVLTATPAFASVKAGLESEAVEGAEVLLRAVEAYRLKPASKGMFPNSLADAVKDLDGGEKRMIDPWGGAFSYSIERGRVFIWTMNPHTDKSVGSQAPVKK